MIDEGAEEEEPLGLGTGGFGEGRGMHLIAVIASYIRYPYKTSQLPLLATRLLTLLCSISSVQDADSNPLERHTPSLVVYLGPNALSLRNVFLKKLHDSLESAVRIPPQGGRIG